MDPEKSASGKPMYMVKSKWVFRGQWNSGWSLLPKSWRPEFKKFVDKGVEDLRINSSEEVASGAEGMIWPHIESSLIRDFHTALDEFGYKILPMQEDDFSYLGIDGIDKILTKNLTELMGLAQHHGIPTRLLDWSFNSLHASYFASAKDFRTGESNELCVWCLNLASPLVNCETNDTRLRFNQNTNLTIRKQPKHMNKYLMAQQGIFTETVLNDNIKDFTKFKLEKKHLFYSYEYYDINKRWPDIEEVLTRNYSILDNVYKNNAYPTLIKLVLNTDQVDRLLQLLQREGYKKSILMPTLDNLAHDVISSWDPANHG